MHGDVKIIRPASMDVPTEKSRGETGRVPKKTHGPLDFGVAPDVQRRYHALVAEIAVLERLAKAAKKAEAAAAVRWIRKAIAEHAISADELGL